MRLPKTFRFEGVSEVYIERDGDRIILSPTRNQAALQQSLEPLAIADFDREAAVTYGRLRAQLEAAGTPIGPLDTQIAAQALALRITLVSNNLREFARVPGLQLANWLGAEAGVT